MRGNLAWAGVLAATMLPLAGCLSVNTMPASKPSAAEVPRRQAYRPGELFSPVVRSGRLLFLSGVIGKEDGIEGVEAETRRALEKIRERLAYAGAGLEDIVKCQVLLADIADYDAMNAVYRTFFTSDPPARTAVAVKGLPAGASVEIDCIAAAR